MKELSLDEKKKISLAILQVFDTLCRKHNLKYFLGYGTLLGAIRHKGFIPWDDDIDVIMLREDYIKFYNVARMELEKTSYIVLSSLDCSYPFCFTKMIDNRTCVDNSQMIKIENLGIGIDIFPYDYLGDNEEKVYQKKNRIAIIESFIRYALFDSLSEVNTGKKSLRKTLEYLFCKAIGWKNWCKLYGYLQKKYICKNKTKYCGLLSKMTRNVVPVFESRLFDDCSTVKFEGRLYPAPADYDSYLKKVYNDYMVLPPEADRIPHSNTAYIREGK